MMPTPFVLNAVVIAKIIPGQITRAPIPIVTQNQPLLKPAILQKGLLKSKRQYQVSKNLRSRRPIIQKEQEE
jgi:hypothetical protein